ncbi:hypothetical protein [Natronobacterium lacisalsi]|nr:hypothetical protein [Halobiforma lacisalsi]
MSVTPHVPGMTPGAPSRNIVLGAAYLSTLAAIASTLLTVAASYRPREGC